MKFVAIVLLAFVAAAVAGPVSVSDNNVGDVVSVKVKADLDINNKINQTLVNVIVAYLNRESGVINVDDEGRPQAPNLPRNVITPEMVEKVRNLLARQ